MKNDEALVLFFLGIYLIACNFVFWFGSTMDWRISEGKKILINNAVYRCEKVQELDLK